MLVAARVIQIQYKAVIRVDGTVVDETGEVDTQMDAYDEARDLVRQAANNYYTPENIGNPHEISITIVIA